MISYWDTSALIPLLIQEPSSAAFRRLWTESDIPSSTRLLYVEASAALHRAYRLDRIDSRQLDILRQDLDSYWSSFHIVELDASLMRQAANLAGRFGLRGYDAVHCAAGLRVGTDRLAVLASGDGKLLEAWKASGLATFSANG